MSTRRTDTRDVATFVALTDVALSGAVIAGLTCTVAARLLGAVLAEHVLTVVVPT